MEVQRRVPLNRQQLLGTDTFKKGKCPSVPGDQHVLSVIDNVSRRFIGKGVRTPAKLCFLLEEDDRNLSGCKFDRGGESAQSPADNDNRFRSQ